MKEKIVSTLIIGMIVLSCLTGCGEKDSMADSNEGGDVEINESESSSDDNASLDEFSLSYKKIMD